jgi:hypothetical protein
VRARRRRCPSGSSGLNDPARSEGANPRAGVGVLPGRRPRAGRPPEHLSCRPAVRQPPGERRPTVVGRVSRGARRLPGSA